MARLKQIRSVSMLSDWWVDLPMRELFWWRELLREPGAGWLRWKTDWRTKIYYDPPDKEDWVVAPPARRLWFYLRSWLAAPRLLLSRELTWEEVKPSWRDVSGLIDEDRKRLWRD